MNIKDKETRSLIIVIFITIFMQVSSLIRNSISASMFGVSQEMDAYNISFNLTNFLFSFFGSAVTTILIPNVAGKQKFSKGVNSFITYLFIGSIIVSIFGILFSKPILSILAGSKSSYFIEVSSKVFSILLLGNIFSFILGVNSAIFQVRKKFMMLKFTQLISYIYILIMLGFVISNNIYQFAIIITTANIVNLILQLYYLKKENGIFSISFSVKDKEFTQMIKNLFPVFFSTGLYQFSLMIDTALASRLGSGQVSILSYANQIVAMINTLILANVILFIYPKLAIQMKKSIDYAKTRLLDYILLVFFVMSAILIVFVLAGRDGITILYERGAFTKQTTSIVYYVALLCIIVLPLNAVRDLLYKFFYADNDTYTPFKNSIKVSVVNVVLSLILSYFWGIYGIVLGTSLSTILSLGMIISEFKRKYSAQLDIKFLLEILKIVISFIISLITINTVKSFFNSFNPVGNILLVSFLSFILFILILKIIKSDVFKVKL